LLKISGEKNGVFLKNQCYEYFLQKLAVVWAKNANIFRQIFWRKYSKNHNIGPSSGANFSYNTFRGKPFSGLLVLIVTYSQN
jgi:hypothetical protein